MGLFCFKKYNPWCCSAQIGCLSTVSLSLYFASFCLLFVVLKSLPPIGSNFEMPAEERNGNIPKCKTCFLIIQMQKPVCRSLRCAYFNQKKMIFAKSPPDFAAPSQLVGQWVSSL